MSDTEYARRLAAVITEVITAMDEQRAEIAASTSAPTSEQPSPYPADINPGIARVVALLTSLGFETTDSGDGETHDHPCDREYGYVVIRVRDPNRLIAEAHRVEAALRSHGVPLGTWPEGEKEPTAAVIQATYSPVDGVATIDICHIHDRMLGTAGATPLGPVTPPPPCDHFADPCYCPAAVAQRAGGAKP